MIQIKHISRANFTKWIETQNSRYKVLLIHFSKNKTWVKTFSMFKNIADSNNNQSFIEFGIHDIETFDDIKFVSEQLNVKVLPAFQIYDCKKKIYDDAGLKKEKELKNFIDHLP